MPTIVLFAVLRVRVTPKDSKLGPTQVNCGTSVADKLLRTSMDTPPHLAVNLEGTRSLPFLGRRSKEVSQFLSSVRPCRTLPRFPL